MVTKPFINYGKNIATAQVGMEVDFRTENFGQLDRHSVRQVDFVGGSKQRTADHPATRLDTSFQWQRLLGTRQVILGAV